MTTDEPLRLVQEIWTWPEGQGPLLESLWPATGLAIAAIALFIGFVFALRGLFGLNDPPRRSVAARVLVALGCAGGAAGAAVWAVLSAPEPITEFSRTYVVVDARADATGGGGDSAVVMRAHGAEDVPLRFAGDADQEWLAGRQDEPVQAVCQIPETEGGEPLQCQLGTEPPPLEQSMDTQEDFWVADPTMTDQRTRPYDQG